jgi:DNA polymerase III epsilon subunit family exonuclease
METFDGKTKWRDMPIAAVDVETTGFDSERDRVIEVGIVQMLNGEVVNRYQQLVNPGIPIPKVVRDLTGIQEEDLIDAPSFKAIAQEVHEHLNDHVVVAYNLSFDRKFVASELERCDLSFPEMPCLDPLVFARALLPHLKSKRLGEVAIELGIELLEAHRAGDDAEAAGRILYAFGDRLPAELEQLLQLQAQWERQQEEQFAIRRGRAPNLSLDAPGVSSGGSSLGPAYIYGDEADPYRAQVRALPDARTKSEQ